MEAHNAAVGDRMVKISGEDPQREYEDARATHLRAPLKPSAPSAS